MVAFSAAGSRDDDQDSALAHQLITLTDKLVINQAMSKRRLRNIFGMLERSQTLRSLTFRGSYIRSISLDTLVKFLGEDTVLTELDLQGTKVSALELARVLGQLQNHKSLRVLNLSSALAEKTDARDMRKVLNSLIAFIESNQHVQSLNLSSVPFEVADPAVVGQALKKNTSLTNLEWKSSKLSDEYLGAMLSAFNGNTTLRELDMSHLHEIGTLGASGLASILAATTCGITQLILTRTSPTVDALRLLAQALAKNQSLTSLRLEHCHISDDGIAALCRGLTENQTLRRLELASQFGLSISSRTLSSLGDMLQQNTSISSLNLSEISFSGEVDEGATASFAAGLSRHSRLQSLDLGDTDIKSESLLMNICRSIASCTALHSLDLSNLVFFGPTPGAASALADFIKSSSSILYLNLNSSLIGADERGRILDAVDENRTLQRLDLGNCKLDEKDFRAICIMLSRNTSLTELILDGAKLPETSDGAAALAHALEANSTLNSLSLRRCNLPVIMLKSLAEAGLMKNQTLTKIDLEQTNIDSVVYEYLEKAVFSGSCRRTISLAGCRVPKRIIDKRL